MSRERSIVASFLISPVVEGTARRQQELWSGVGVSAGRRGGGPRGWSCVLEVYFGGQIKEKTKSTGISQRVVVEKL